MLWDMNELLMISYLGQWIHSSWCVFFHGIHYIHPLVWIRKNVPTLDALRPDSHRIGKKRLQHHHRLNSQNHAYKSINGVTKVSFRFGVVTYRDSAFQTKRKRVEEQQKKIMFVCGMQVKINKTKEKIHNGMQSIFWFYLFTFHSSRNVDVFFSSTCQYLKIK